ncbi:adhesion G protein-coupled receptor F4 isoform X2 [Hippopotamus amphibius kiboko]|uniref:adhesion G protein-coupled receptor F4 isoform X2 n=1 Tax=Hippopotamus amphibius kiboko TaxID=575201 RepID=UPI0025966626|nr:adhesion G protein-coupled receptor F4 isoform X2 [Hippopotamus amphibius kiboko]XP_057555920.1 adhesion G protein-coupled receptor F4 isoform X2 [Hippopotamus amphibius kiboko]XP_057555921.1 adhesion G protein-coupled receptor F4 isoform X2 [Hippopotamus amphibius kiboko]
MKSQTITICCLMLFLAAECSHPKSKTHIKGGDKLQGPEGKPKTGRRQEKCHGPCTTSSNCSQPCAQHFRGEIEFICNGNKWQKSIETCTSLSVETLFMDSKSVSRLSVAAPPNSPHMLDYHVPEPVESVAQGIQKNCPLDYACIIDAVKSSETTSGNIAFIVELLKNISIHLSDNVTGEKMKSYSKVANHILDTAVIPNWAFIPYKNASSDLLQSVNWFARRLRIRNESEHIADELFIQTKGFPIDHNTSERSFSFSMNTSNTTESILGMIEIPRQELWKLPPNASQAVGIAFSTLGAVLKEAHLQDASLPRPLNGLVLSVILPERLKQILFTFEKMNKSRDARAQCVGWNARKRMWDENVCETTLDTTSKVKCWCNYTHAMMSFSILMSPRSVDNTVLDYITCIGLSVSILSLILCLVIETAVWSRVVMTEISYMRHVCIVNIAVSLLTANVWFILGSIFNKKAQDYNWCVAVTFFTHFFYLSLFFWMLFKALLIIYGLLVIFQRMMKSHMIAIGFAIGYGCPLVIAVTTVAITVPGRGYLRHGACWLNWDDTRALLAFAVPALVIVAVNLVVVLVVAVNTQRPSIGSSKSQDVAIVMRISKNVAILTPLLGLTWGFGIATLIEGTSLIFHIIFALLNAFQGFFILLFGTIMDHKIRDALRMRMSSPKRRSRVAGMHR